MSQIRYNILKDRYVIVAANRAVRPNHFFKKDDAFDEESPFTYGNEHLTPPEIFARRDEKNAKPNSSGWRCRVVPNLYNALSIEEDNRRFVDGFFEGIGAFGAHEVVIETPEKNMLPSEFSTANLEDIFHSYQARAADLSSDSRIKYVSIFKNHGAGAGATLKHPHSQIIATSFVPKNIREETSIAKEYYQKHSRVLMDDVISEESRAKKRVLFESENFFAFTPYASLFPFEVVIAAKNSFCDIFYADGHLIREMSESVRKIFKAYAKIDRNISFNMNLRVKPINDENGENYARYFRFYIEFMPRIYNLAGFELGSGEFINPIEPEVAADFLRRNF